MASNSTDALFAEIASTLNDVTTTAREEVANWRFQQRDNLEPLRHVRNSPVTSMTHDPQTRELVIDCDAGIITLGIDLFPASRLIALNNQALINLVPFDGGNYTGMASITLEPTEGDRVRVRLRWRREQVQATADLLNAQIYG